MALATLHQTFARVPPTLLPVSHAGHTLVWGKSWQKALPVLKGAGVRLRELRLSDAAALQAALTTEEVTRFISPPPATVAGFERFIDWAVRQRARGELFCFAIVPDGAEQPVGIIQVRQLNGSFDNAEWGFAIAREFWGSGLFLEAAWVALAFCFLTVRVRRLEARAATVNGRGNGALRKLGASCDGRLKHAFVRDGEYFDQYLWSITREEWEHLPSS